MTSKSKIWGILKQVFTWIVVVAAVGMMIFTIISVTTFDRNNRSIFGYKLFIDLTDSMSPDYFNAGDIVIVKKVKDPTSIKAGDIITYQSLIEGETYGRAVTHMVRYTSSDADGRKAIESIATSAASGVRYASADDKYKTCFLTYGVATGANDSVIVSEDFVLGRYAGRLPYVGYFFQYLKTPIGYIVCILVPFLLLIGMQGLNCIKVFKKYKKEQTDAMAAEKAQIEAERAESQRMMQELMALRSQLSGGAPQGAQTQTPYGQQPYGQQSYGQQPYGQPQYAQPGAQPRPAQPQYTQPGAQPRPAQPQYTQPGAQPRPAQPQYAQPGAQPRPAQPQYAQPGAQPRPAQPQYAQPGTQPRPAQPQYAQPGTQPRPAQPQYAQPGAQPRPAQPQYAQPGAQPRPAQPQYAQPGTQPRPAQPQYAQPGAQPRPVQNPVQTGTTEKK